MQPKTEVNPKPTLDRLNTIGRILKIKNTPRKLDRRPKYLQEFLSLLYARQ